MTNPATPALERLGRTQTPEPRLRAEAGPPADFAALLENAGTGSPLPGSSPSADSSDTAENLDTESGESRVREGDPRNDQTPANLLLLQIPNPEALAPVPADPGEPATPAKPVGEQRDQGEGEAAGVRGEGGLKEGMELKAGKGDSRGASESSLRPGKGEKAAEMASQLPPDAENLAPPPAPNAETAPAPETTELLALPPPDAEDTDTTPPEADMKPPPGHGTPSAKRVDATMTAEQENKNAGWERKNLPPAALVDANDLESQEPPAKLRTKSDLAESRQTGASPVGFEAAVKGHWTDLNKTVSAPVSVDYVEKTQALISEAAVRIQTREGAALEVTIKANAGTELSLHLKFHAGQVEARAICQRGDYTGLQADWPELQDRLARQGIKLAALEPNSNHSFPSSTGHNPGHRRPTSEPVPEPAIATAPTRINLQPKPPSPRRTPTKNWESWA